MSQRVLFWAGLAHAVLIVYAALDILLPISGAVFFFVEGRDELKEASLVQSMENSCMFPPCLVDRGTSIGLFTAAGLALLVGIGLLLFKAYAAARAVYRTLTWARSSPLRLAENARLVSNHDAPKQLWACVEDVADKMKIPLSSIDLFITTEAHLTPSMASQGGRVLLFMPFGMGLLAAIDPESIKAMVAHELAHHLHRDGWLWGVVDGTRQFFSDYLEEELKTVFLAAGAYYYLLIRPILDGEGGIPGFFVAAVFGLIVVAPSWGLAWGTRAILLVARRNSEFAADWLASQVVGKATMKKMLSRYLKPEGGNLHVPPDVRIEMLARA